MSVAARRRVDPQQRRQRCPRLDQMHRAQVDRQAGAAERAPRVVGAVSSPKYGHPPVNSSYTAISSGADYTRRAICSPGLAVDLGAVHLVEARAALASLLRV